MRELLSKLETTGDETIAEIGFATGSDTEKLAKLVAGWQRLVTGQSESMFQGARSALTSRHHAVVFQHSNIINVREIPGSGGAAFFIVACTG